MSDYRQIAAFYDSLNADVDYEAIADFYEADFRKYGLKPEIVLDLACGTGTLTGILQRRGYDMIGVDGSEEMLGVAMEKLAAEEKMPLLLCQNMTELDLYGTIDAAVCCLDGLNSLEERDLCAALEKVSLFTVPGGLFLFDVNSPYKFEHVFGDKIYLYDTPEVYCVWQNHWDKAEQLCDFELTYFVRNGGVYRRSDEMITEYCHSQKRITEALRRAGFELLEVCVGLDFAPPEETSERLFYIARKV